MTILTRILLGLALVTGVPAVQLQAGTGCPPAGCDSGCSSSCLEGCAKEVTNIKIKEGVSIKNYYCRAECCPGTDDGVDGDGGDSGGNTLPLDICDVPAQTLDPNLCQPACDSDAQVCIPTADPLVGECFVQDPLWPIAYQTCPGNCGGLCGDGDICQKRYTDPVVEAQCLTEDTTELDLCAATYQPEACTILCKDQTNICLGTGPGPEQICVDPSTWATTPTDCGISSGGCGVTTLTDSGAACQSGETCYMWYDTTTTYHPSPIGAQCYADICDTDEQPGPAEGCPEADYCNGLPEVCIENSSGSVNPICVNLAIESCPSKEDCDGLLTTASGPPGSTDLPPPPTGPKGDVCADESGQCACTGDIWYGHDQNWYVLSGQDQGSPVTCSSSLFGGDPKSGTRKQCYCVSRCEVSDTCTKWYDETEEVIQAVCIPPVSGDAPTICAVSNLDSNGVSCPGCSEGEVCLEILGGDWECHIDPKDLSPNAWVVGRPYREYCPEKSCTDASVTCDYDAGEQCKVYSTIDGGSSKTDSIVYTCVKPLDICDVTHKDIPTYDGPASTACFDAAATPCGRDEVCVESVELGAYGCYIEPNRSNPPAWPIGSGNAISCGDQSCVELGSLCDAGKCGVYSTDTFNPSYGHLTTGVDVQCSV